MPKIPILQAQQLALAYTDAHGRVNSVLHDFSLEVRAGETVVLLGPSGTGKSSLLRVLAGLQPAQNGSVHLFGQTVRSPHPRAAFVFQSPPLLPWLTVRDNVAFGLNFSRQPHRSRHSVRQQVEEALVEVGLSYAATHYPAQLSGGMAQRVALARALARAPQLLLLDEPFGALDAITRNDMQDLLRRLIVHHHTAAVLVTHDIDEALLLADRIILIGHSPARIIGQWQPPKAISRRPNLVDMGALRSDILSALNNARYHTQQHQTVEFVI